MKVKLLSVVETASIVNTNVLSNYMHLILYGFCNQENICPSKYSQSLYSIFCIHTKYAYSHVF